MMAATLLKGEQALAKLQSPQFQEQWLRLYQACSWASTFQSINFVLCWWQHYADNYTPLVILEQDSQRLIHLWLLAQDKSTGAIVHVGAHQAEYQCWLSESTNFGAFLGQSLALIKPIAQHHELTLSFLPPRLSLLLAEPSNKLAAPHIIRNEQQPVMRFDSEQLPWSSLRKKSNKSKLSRLRKLGDVNVELASGASPNIINDLQHIATVYDLRQGAINQCLPFGRDSKKLPFTKALLRDSQDVQLLKLTLNGKVIAAIVGVINHAEFSVAIFSYDPIYSRHSPGKLLMLMGAELLAQHQLKAIDLTPGGRWKERYANTYKEVSVLRLFFDSTAYFRASWYESVLQQGRRLLKYCHVEPQYVKNKLTQLSQSLSSSSSHHVELPNYLDSYQIDTHCLMTKSNKVIIRENQLADFVEFSKQLDEKQQQLFLSHSLSRFETGVVGYSIKESGVVKCCGWMVKVTKEQSRDQVGQSSASNDHCLLIDLYYGDSVVADKRQVLLTEMVKHYIQSDSKSDGLTLLVNEKLLPNKTMTDSAFTYIDSVIAEQNQLSSHSS